MTVLPFLKKNTPILLGFIAIMSGVLIYSSCKTQAKSNKSYYFPIDKIQSGLIYEYQFEGNKDDYTLPPYYYTFQLDTVNGKQLLRSTYYNVNFMGRF